jgi:heme/copper-type cytochrome/quinol oxidase subunit 4
MTIITILGVALPALIVGFFAYFLHLSDGSEREHR